jgi:hypothetical protein
MSGIQDAYDYLRVAVPLITSFVGKFEIPYPESLQDNNSLILKNGWGVIVGDSSPYASQEYCRTLDEVSFSVVITKESKNSDSNPSLAAATNKELLGNLNDLRVRLMNSDKLGIPLVITKIDFTGASGIEFSSPDKYNIRAITANFTFLIEENLT